MIKSYNKNNNDNRMGLFDNNGDVIDNNQVMSD